MQHNTEENGKAQRIAELNDALRKNSSNPFGHDMTVITHGIQAEISALESDTLPDWFLRGEIRKIVAEFDSFSEDNDPHGERDYGSFTWRNVRCFWKIDYYNTDLSGGSSDPADPSITARVLTIATTAEY